MKQKSFPLKNKEPSRNPLTSVEEHCCRRSGLTWL